MQNLTKLNTLLQSKFSITVFGLTSLLAVAGCAPGTDLAQPKAATEQKTEAASASAIAKKATPFQPEFIPSIYRFAKIASGAYFYTGSVEEATYITQNLADFRYEGAVFEQDASATGQPVYRFANTNNGGYFYTGSAAERDATILNYPNMRFEGTTFSVAGASTSSNPVYRLANLRNGAYLYTSSADERNYAISLGFWRDEGTTFSVPKGSALAGKSWSAGLNIHSPNGAFWSISQQSVDDQFLSAAVSDLGDVFVVFSSGRSSPSDYSLYVTRGKIDPVTQAITWTNPALLDWTAQPSAMNARQFKPTNFLNGTKVAVSPNGDAVVSWLARGACNNTTYTTSNLVSCDYIVNTVFDSATQTWGSPRLIISSPDAFDNVFINNNKDVAHLFAGWIGSEPFTYTPAQGLIVSSLGEPLAKSLMIEQVQSDSPRFGGLTNWGSAYSYGVSNLAGQENTLTEDAITTSGSSAYYSPLIVYRGAGPIKILSAAVSSSGAKAIAFYEYSNASASAPSLKVASRAQGSNPWEITQVSASETGNWNIFVSDDQQLRLIKVDNVCKHYALTGGTWRSIPIPSDCNFNKPANSPLPPSFDRNGNFISLAEPYGLQRWVSYDAKRNKLVHSAAPAATTSGAGIVLGFTPTSLRPALVPRVALSANGFAVSVSQLNYDVLPTPTNQAGTNTFEVKRPWAFVLR